MPAGANSLKAQGIDQDFSFPHSHQGQNQRAEFTLPRDRWLPSIAACGLACVRGDAFPKWNGDLLAGGLAGATLQRIHIESGKVEEREELLYGLGRVRDVAVAPDGSVYVVLNGPDKIVRLYPSP